MTDNIITEALADESKQEPKTTGMRRDWNFTLALVHTEAHCRLRYAPQWTSVFIDPDQLAEDQQDIDAKASKIKPFAAFTDITAALRTDYWEEVKKEVTLRFCYVPPKESLKAFCKRCVQHVLKNPQVVSVDGKTNLRRLTIGQKLNCRHKLAGLDSFCFEYFVSEKSSLKNNCCYAIGCVARTTNQGYLFTVECGRKEELEAFLAHKFLPHVTSTANCALGVEALAYKQGLKFEGLQKQREQFGELQYFDPDAAVSFEVAMHPCTIRPDFSPIQNVDVGSRACLTVEMEVYQRLFDDAAQSDVLGIPKYRSNTVLFYLEVEEVTLNGFPSVLSIAKYSQLKMDRLLTTFAGSKMVGTPQTLNLGARCGRSATVTFHYDAEGALQGYLVKAMLVSTLIGNKGCTAMYVTKMGQGLFDAHLYLFQQFLAGIVFYDERSLTPHFSRFKSKNIRLTEQDLPKAYAGASQKDRNVMMKHIQCLERCTDGRVLDQTVEISVITVHEKSVEAKRKEAELLKQERLMFEQEEKERRQASSSSPSHQQQQQQRQTGGEEEEEGGAAAADAGTATATGEAQEDGKQKKKKKKKEAAQEGEAAAQEEGSSSKSAAEKTTTTSGATGDAAQAADQPHPQDSGEHDGGDDELEASSSGDDEFAALPDDESLISVTDIVRLHAGDVYEGEEEEGTGGAARFADGDEHGAEEGGDADSSPLGLQPSEEEGDEGADADDDSLHVAKSRGISRVSIASDGRRGSGARSSTPTRDAAAAAALMSDESETSVKSPLQVDEEQREQERRVQQEHEEEELRHAMEPEDKVATLRGPSLREIYVQCCEAQHCRPNSYLAHKLPDNPRLTLSIEELDMSSNYVGRHGLVALLHFLEYLPKVRAVHLNDMGLDNTDVTNVCQVLEHNETVTALHLRNNPKITLPSVRHLFALLSRNTRITAISLGGTKIGDALIDKIEKEAEKNATVANNNNNAFAASSSRNSTTGSPKPQSPNKSQ